MGCNHKSVSTIFAHISQNDSKVNVAWHFPDRPNEPVTVAVPRAQAMGWIEQPIGLGLRCQRDPVDGTYGMRDLQPHAMPHDPDGALGALGEEMFRVLFTPDVVSRWNQALSRSGHAPVRIVFQWDSAQCVGELDPAMIPFTLLRCPEAGKLARITADFALAKNVSIVCRITNYMGGEPRASLNHKRARVLVFTAPINIEDVKREKETQESDRVLRCIRAAQRWRRAEVTAVISSPKGKATWAAFCERVGNHDVVHFIGHGRIRTGAASKGAQQRVGQLLFETADGKEKDWRTMAEVATVLRNAGVKLLIFNCCETVSFSPYACVFPAVIGHQFAVTGDSVERFELAFFRKLFKTGCVEDAVWEGRQAIWKADPQTSWEHRTPLIYLQDDGKGSSPPSPDWGSVFKVIVGALLLAIGFWVWRFAPAKLPLEGDNYWLFANGERNGWIPQYFMPADYDREQSFRVIAGGGAEGGACMALTFAPGLSRDRFCGFAWTQYPPDQLHTGKRLPAPDFRDAVGVSFRIRAARELFIRPEALVLANNDEVIGDASGPIKPEGGDLVSIGQEWRELFIPAAEADLSRVISPLYLALRFSDQSEDVPLDTEFLVFVDQIRWVFPDGQRTRALTRFVAVACALGGLCIFGVALKGRKE